jgi:SOS-response transcriptional repressor LexA
MRARHYSTRELSASQHKVLCFAIDYYAENDQLPPMSAVKAHFGYGSTNAATSHYFALEAKGYVEKNAAGKYRFTQRNVCHIQKPTAPATTSAKAL